MLTVSKPSKNRIELNLSGALNAEEMRVALDTLIQQSEGIQNGTMLYTILDLEMPTLGAIVADFQRIPQFFGLIGKFDKCAVLCDTAWIRTAAEIEGAVIPSLEIKSFELSEIKAAQAWLKGADHEDSDEGDIENFPV